MLPNCSYPDIWSLYVNSHDCQLFTRYFTALSPQLWTNVADRVVSKIKNEAAAVE